MRKGCLVFGMLILACATLAQAKTSLHRAPKTLTASVKVTPQILRGKIIFLRGDDVWMFDPITRKENILFKSRDVRWVPYDSENAFDFSPDLKSVVVKSYHPDFIGNDLAVINLETGKEKKIAMSAPEDDIVEPRFSPDGKQIAYVRRGGFHWESGESHLEIWRINADGSNDHPIIGHTGPTNKFESFFNPFWSREEKRLLFTYHGGAAEDYFSLQQGELQTCTMDGSDVKKFDGNYGEFIKPDISPDGKLRVAAEFIDDKSRYYPVIRLYTSQNRKVRDLVTNNDLIHEANPLWSADSKRVIFQATQMFTQTDAIGYAREVRSNDLWAVSLDGKNLRRIVKNANYLVAVL